MRVVESNSIGTLDHPIVVISICPNCDREHLLSRCLSIKIVPITFIRDKFTSFLLRKEMLGRLALVLRGRNRLWLDFKISLAHWWSFHINFIVWIKIKRHLNFVESWLLRRALQIFYWRLLKSWSNFIKSRLHFGVLTSCAHKRHRVIKALSKLLRKNLLPLTGSRVLRETSERLTRNSECITSNRGTKSSTLLPWCDRPLKRL